MSFVSGRYFKLPIISQILNLIKEIEFEVTFVSKMRYKMSEIFSIITALAINKPVLKTG